MEIERETRIKGYKITDENGCTLSRTQWGPTVTHAAPGGEPCTEGVVHWYLDKLIAVLADPIHGQHDRYGTARLWICEGVKTGADNLKCWGTSCTTIKEINKPCITIAQRVRWAIYIAQDLHPPYRWKKWAAAWLANTDRSRAAAQAVADMEAKWAAPASVRTAEASVWSAWAAASAARAAVWTAAEASVLAAETAQSGIHTARLVQLAERAIRDEPGDK